MLRSRLLLTLLILSLGGLSVGCDSRSPVTAPTPEDVEGIYVFTEYRFVPAATGVAPVNVLERLVPANTNLELLGGGQALLRYRFQGEQTNIVAGTFDVNVRQQIRLRMTDAGALGRLLLTTPFILERPTEERLTAEVPITVNLAAFDPERYAGLTEVRGQLFMQLQRTDS